MLEALPEVPAAEHPSGRLQPGMALDLLQQLLHAACTAAAAAGSSEAQAAGTAAQAQSLVQHSTALLLPLALQLLAVPPAEASEAQHSKGLLAASMACAAQSGGWPGGSWHCCSAQACCVSHPCCGHLRCYWCIP
jgi:hypothetical protein